MIGIITNPRARKNAEDPARIERLRQILDVEGTVRQARALEEIADIARDFRRSGVDILVIDGGDGTIHHTVSAFITIYGDAGLPPIAILRGGTMNTIANSLGIKGRSEEILRRVVRTVKEGCPLEVIRAHALGVNDRYGFIFGLGFPVSLLSAYYRGRGRGRWKSMRVLFQILLSTIKEGDGEGNFFLPFEADIWLDGEKLPMGRYTAILGSTVKGVGLGFKPTRRVGKNKGLFQILCLGMGAKRMALNALKVLFRMELRGHMLFDRMATRALIRLQRQADMQIDGEIFVNQWEIRLQVGPSILFIR
jgi:diacylglycerol kinase family enzyme